MALLGQTRDGAMARERMRQSLIGLASTLAGGRARIVILFLTLLLTVWQLYFFAWSPLQEMNLLPEGLTGVSASLEVQALTKIQEARTGRLQHPSVGFAGVDQYFSVSSEAPVAP